MKYGYVLITATWNEKKYINHTIEAVLNQTIRPSSWVIVSDGSTDGTDDIVKEAAAGHGFILYLRKERTQEQKGFASKVYAIQEGTKHVKGLSYSFIGHLDSDVSFAPNYYEQILNRFENNSRLGIAGGFIWEQTAGRFRSRRSNTIRSVAGAIQFFRRECHEAIGGLWPLEHGGEDWLAEIMARMSGWEIKAFPDLQVMHYKRSGDTRGLAADNFRQGQVDYLLGTHPVFEVAKIVRRVPERPLVFGALWRLIGYSCLFAKRSPRPVPRSVMDYLRREQLDRIISSFLLKKHFADHFGS